MINKRAPCTTYTLYSVYVNRYIYTVQLWEWRSKSPRIDSNDPPPPQPKGERDTLACGWGGGGALIQTTGEKAKHSVYCTLWYRGTREAPLYFHHCLLVGLNEPPLKMERKIRNVLYFIISGGYTIHQFSLTLQWYLLNVGPGAVDNLDVVGENWHGIIHGNNGRRPGRGQERFVSLLPCVHQPK